MLESAFQHREIQDSNSVKALYHQRIYLLHYLTKLPRERWASVQAQEMGYDYKCSKNWFQWFQEMKQEPSASHLEPKVLELLSSHTFLSFNY